MKIYNAEKEQITMQYLQGSYLRIPRKVINRILTGSRTERQVGLLHLSLINVCFHTDGFVGQGREKIPCAKGELISSKRELEKLTGICYGSIGRLLQQLIDECLIETTRIENRTRIRVCGYDWLTDPKRVETIEAQPVASPPQVEKKTFVSFDYKGINPDTPFT